MPTMRFHDGGNRSRHRECVLVHLVRMQHGRLWRAVAGAAGEGWLIRFFPGAATSREKAVRRPMS